jgi:hypothetical protein
MGRKLMHQQAHHHCHNHHATIILTTPAILLFSAVCYHNGKFNAVGKRAKGEVMAPWGGQDCQREARGGGYVAGWGGGGLRCHGLSMPPATWSLHIVVVVECDEDDPVVVAFIIRCDDVIAIRAACCRRCRKRRMRILRQRRRCAR